jgi:hypothetical protein
MSENSRLQAKLDSIVMLYEHAIVLALEEGERNAYAKLAEELDFPFIAKAIRARGEVK